jgi:hypothetical protein
MIKGSGGKRGGVGWVFHRVQGGCGETSANPMEGFHIRRRMEER